MTTATCWSLVSSGLGVFGGIVLAFSVNPFLSMLKTTAEAQEFSLKTLANPNGDAVIIVGLDKHLASAAVSTNRRVFFGALLLVLSFSAQVISVFSS